MGVVTFTCQVNRVSTVLVVVFAEKRPPKVRLGEKVGVWDASVMWRSRWSSVIPLEVEGLELGR